jgi:hypothetical protein
LQSHPGFGRRRSGGIESSEAPSRSLKNEATDLYRFGTAEKKVLACPQYPLNLRYRYNYKIYCFVIEYPNQMYANKFLLGKEVYVIVNAALEVLKELGHGFHEKPYEKALVVELRAKLEWERIILTQAKPRIDPKMR